MGEQVTGIQSAVSCSRGAQSVSEWPARELGLAARSPSHTWRGGASPSVFATTEAAPAICWSRLGWRGGTSRPIFEAGTRHAASRTSSFGAVMLGPHTAWGSLWKEASFHRARTLAFCTKRRCRSACGSGRQRFAEKARPGVAPSLQNVVFRYRVYAHFPGHVHLLRGAVAPSPVSALE